MRNGDVTVDQIRWTSTSAGCEPNKLSFVLRLQKTLHFRTSGKRAGCLADGRTGAVFLAESRKKCPVLGPHDVTTHGSLPHQHHTTTPQPHKHTTTTLTQHQIPKHYNHYHHHHHHTNTTK
ncbi:hypothetical protein E2C01_026366 [Portunus trituberculatus]|uniref:Uncharacterized protein n=1 Tax=Portunus trituberculatus TaxID=210409 RepID=A0A5B7EID0_PORTR|nr:hypothetical protein [Portunus trituberculatus]